MSLYMQVALDEIIFTPVHIAAFFSFLTAAEGGNWEVCAQLCIRGPYHFSQVQLSDLLHASVTLKAHSCVQDIKEKLRKDYVSTLITELVIWPGYQVRRSTSLLHVNMRSVSNQCL